MSTYYGNWAELSDSERAFYEAWEVLTDDSIATDDEIGLVIAINGKTLEALEKILSVRTGWSSFEGYLNERDSEEE